MSKHHLTERDAEARRAECSVCGPVKIQKSGNGWTCANRANAQSRKQKRRSEARRQFEYASSHKLSWRDPVTRAGLCPVCGPVTIVAYGRGWTCPASPGARVRVHQQEAPTAYCDACKLLDGQLVWLTEGECRRCAETDLGALLREQGADERLMDGFDGWGGAGMHLVGLSDPYAMPDYESAVPGWKTLGSRREAVLA